MRDFKDSAVTEPSRVFSNQIEPTESRQKAQSFAFCGIRDSTNFQRPIFNAIKLKEKFSEPFLGKRKFGANENQTRTSSAVEFDNPKSSKREQKMKTKKLKYLEMMFKSVSVWTEHEYQTCSNFLNWPVKKVMKWVAKR